MIKNNLRLRYVFIVFIIVLMFSALILLLSPASGLVKDGRVNLSEKDFKKSKIVALSGNWEFYWNRLLTADAFHTDNPPIMDSTIKVPGGWSNKGVGLSYSNQGFATYRILINYPSLLDNPAIKIQGVVAAYKLYANGQFITEVGKVSDKLSDFQRGYESRIVDLPKDSGRLELIIQVTNFSNHRAGLRGNIIFGSRQVLNQQTANIQALQLLFIGSVFIFSIYYFLLFLLQRRNRTALFFAMLCFITALHSSLWGEIPLKTLFPSLSLDTGIRLTYFSGYNTLPIVILFIYSIYSLDFNKKRLGLYLIPTLLFNILLFLPIEIMAYFNKYLLILSILQILYIVIILIKIALRNRVNSILILAAMSVFVVTFLMDLLGNAGYGSIYINYIAIYGNFVVIMVMSYIQAKQQADTHKKLIAYNEKLIEADKLRDKIMATEMSFLQAQIKPHFLYNALNAIANVCEKDGKAAAKLVINMAVYLRRSLEFNSLNKMSTIENELEFVDTYFTIEQARFGLKLQLRKEVSISSDSQIPVLVLQPLVENAVRHGISKKPEGGTVCLKAIKTEEGILIEVSDDGVGIDKIKLAALLSESENDRSVGLMNIHNRLLRLYGRGLEIISEEGKGTSVKILLPEGRRND